MSLAFLLLVEREENTSVWVQYQPQSSDLSWVLGYKLHLILPQLRIQFLKSLNPTAREPQNRARDGAGVRDPSSSSDAPIFSPFPFPSGNPGHMGLNIKASTNGTLQYTLP